MTKRSRLIWKTFILCSIPVIMAALVLVLMRQDEERPYVPGKEQEGITRNLDRRVEEGLSGIRFADVASAAGIEFEHFPFRRTSQLPEDMGSGLAWGDFDGDGFPDLFLVNFAAPIGGASQKTGSSPVSDRLYRNLGDGSFEDVTQTAGVGTAHAGMGAAWGDYDGDGDLDLFVSSWGENILWENRGDGTFEDVSRRAGIDGEGFWAGGSWRDFDLDGDQDLYVCGYVYYEAEEPGSPMTLSGTADFPFTLNPSSYLPHPNRFYVNRGDGTFEERAREAGVLGEKGRSLSAAWVDLNEDGLPDLYVSNDVSDNLLYLNRGDGSFANISYEALVADYRGSMGIAVGDWDRDRDLDLFVTHWIAQENALYSNLASETGEPGQLLFGDDADRVGLGQIALDLIGWGTVFFDANNDGWLDLFIANGSTFQDLKDPSRLLPMPPHLYWNRGAGKGFFEIGQEAGIRTDPPGGGRGVALADYDQDGDLDVAVLRHGGRTRLLRNDSRRGHWAALRVCGQNGAPAIGARIEAAAGNRGYVAEVGSGPSYLSQNHPDVHLGLGTANRIDSLTIRWPGGAKTAWKNLEADRLWLFVHGEDPRPLHANTANGTAESRGGIGRRTSGMSAHAVVSDLSSPLSREQKRRFWELKGAAGRLFGDRQWREAAEIFAQMTEIDPTHEDALYYWGNCHLELDQYVEAKACWEQLLDINPSSSRAWIQIGILHTLTTASEIYDLDAATRAFQEAHRINREESGPLELWGEAALAGENLAEAREILSSAYRMNPRSTSALYLSGYVAWRDGDRIEARALLDRAVESMEAVKPVAGVLGEGDTRSAAMFETRRKAAARRLFAGCLEALRDSSPPVDPQEAFSWVDEALAALPGAQQRKHQQQVWSQP